MSTRTLLLLRECPHACPHQSCLHFEVLFGFSVSAQVLRLAVGPCHIPHGDSPGELLSWVGLMWSWSEGILGVSVLLRLQALLTGAEGCSWDLEFLCNTHCWVQAAASPRVTLCWHRHTWASKESRSISPRLSSTPRLGFGEELVPPSLLSSPCYSWRLWGFNGRGTAREDPPWC